MTTATDSVTGKWSARISTKPWRKKQGEGERTGEASIIFCSEWKARLLIQLIQSYKKEGDGKEYIFFPFEAAYLEHFGDWKVSQITRSDLFEFRDKIKGTPKQRGALGFHS